MRIRALGYFGMLLAVPLWWSSRRPREPYPVATDLMITVPILLDAGGNSFGLYDRANIDDVVHFLNAAILMTAFGSAISDRADSRWEAAGITLGVGTAGSLGWEAMEYAGQILGFRGMELTARDTVIDFVESMAGSVLAAAITAARWQPHHDRTATHPVLETPIHAP
jgi:hypothetical protein